MNVYLHSFRHIRWERGVLPFQGQLIVLYCIRDPLDGLGHRKIHGELVNLNNLAIRCCVVLWYVLHMLDRGQQPLR